ncbi:MAG TPA: hypothetical protein VGM10_13450, partial [Actinocrinis sp.]
MRELLGETRVQRDFERRAHVSSVLAAVAAGSNVAEVWLREEPQCPDAWLLSARVEVVRALSLFDRQGPTPQVIARLKAAMGACRQAYAEGGYDPVVWVAVLGLLRTGVWPPVAPSTAQLAAVREIPGPWGLVENVILPLLPGHREAGHRLLACFSPRFGGRNEDHAVVALWLSGLVEPGHPWRLLPAVAALDYDPAQQQAPAGAQVGSSTRARTIRGMLRQIGPAPKETVEDPDVAHHRAQLEAALRVEVEPESWAVRCERIGRVSEETYIRWFAARTD